MKPALVIASITGGLALAGAATVGAVYLVSHRTPAPQPVAETAPASAFPPLMAQQSPLPALPTVRRRHRVHICPTPVAYRRPARTIVRPIIRTRLHILQPGYGPPPGVNAPPLRGWDARPYWRAEWRSPRWEGPPPRFAYAHAPYERGPIERRPWSGW